MAVIFLYPHINFLGIISFFVYATQIIIGFNALKGSIFKFRTGVVELYGPSYTKDKKTIIGLLFLLLVLTQFPIVAYSLYPSSPDISEMIGNTSTWKEWYNNRPNKIAIMWDIIMSFVIIRGIIYVHNECKDPKQMLEEYITKKKHLEELKENCKKEEVRKISLYGDNYKSSCAGVVFSQDNSRMWINELEYRPEEILSVEIDNISTTIQLPQEIKAKTSTGSMIGRGIVGAALFGPAGAIIGGATAKKNSIISEKEIITNYRYKLRISTIKPEHELISYESSNLNSIRSCQALILAFVHRNKSLKGK